jgi:hypothetical protein
MTDDDVVLVPREPSEAMLLAGCQAVARIPRDELMAASLLPDRGHGMARLKMRARWAAMVAAAGEEIRNQKPSAKEAQD